METSPTHPPTLPSWEKREEVIWAQLWAAVSNNQGKVDDVSSCVGKFLWVIWSRWRESVVICTWWSWRNLSILRLGLHSPLSKEAPPAGHSQCSVHVTSQSLTIVLVFPKVREMFYTHSSRVWYLARSRHENIPLKKLQSVRVELFDAGIEQNITVLTQLLKVELILLSTGQALFWGRNVSILHINSGNISPSDCLTITLPPFLAHPSCWFLCISAQPDTRS